jgi:hypothetical protein
MLRKLRSKATFANVAAALALFLSLSTGAAYATHERIFSSDIVDGQVKRPDIGTGAVSTRKVADGMITRAKLAAGSVTGAKVADNSLTGADVQEGTLTGVDAATLAGYPANAIVRVGDAVRVTDEILPDCSPGTDYMSASIEAPTDGLVLINGSVSFRTANGTGEAFALRIEQTSPGVVAAGFQEEVLSQAGRANIATTHVFGVSAGTNSFVLHACDSNDNMGIDTGTAIEGQMSLLFTPFGV